MHQNGFPTFPEPNPHIGDGNTAPMLIGGPNGGNIDVTSSAFQSALQTCAKTAKPVPTS